MRGLVLSMLAVALLGGVDPRPAPPRPGLSWEQADSLGRKIEALEHRGSAKGTNGETVLVTEGELNSFLNLSAKMPAGLAELEIHLERDRVGAKAMVDLEQMGAKQGGSLNRLALLGGRLPVEVKGRLSNDGGFGSLDFELVRLGPVSIPVTVLAQLVASATRSAENPQGFDIQSPFRLPYQAKRVRLQPGRVLLDF